MAKNKIASREQLKRQGNFWTEGALLSSEDEKLLEILRSHAVETGHTPRVS